MRLSIRLCLMGLTLLTVLALWAAWQVETQAQGPSEEQLAQGAQLYAENCTVCHGPNGEGRVGATLAQDWPSIRPDLRVKTSIEAGVSGSLMPAWSKENGGPLTDDQIEALTLYILSWETGGIPSLSPTPTYTPHPPITPIPDVEGDPNRGAVLYAENCAMCHGPKGEGRVGATLAKNWPSVRPDLQVKTITEQGVPGSPMPAWSRENGGPLSDEDINDVVAFVLSWQVSTTSEAPEPAPTPAPSALRGPLGLAVFLAGLLALVLVSVIGALTRREDTAED
jgi:mono/diheme cytochrome c family protein